MKIKFAVVTISLDGSDLRDCCRITPA